jgi:orotate phosphoribosyltransferase
VNFRSIAQLSDQLLHWSHRLPKEVEVVAGVPRSGLLAANLLALYLNVPLTDVDGLLAGRCFESGTIRRKPFKDGSGTLSMEQYLGTRRTVLVLDDTLLSGRTMRAVRERVEAAGLPHRILYGAVYVLPRNRRELDHYCETLNGPRVFEWNVLHGELVRRFCVTLDGVLCRRPTHREAGRRYESYIRDAQPNLIPSTEIGWLITERPERYREETEAWLDKHGIRYRHLFMRDVRGAVDPESGTASAFKADVYRATDASLFVESSFLQSLEIAKLTGRHVLCTDSMQLVHPGTVPLVRPGMYGDLHPTPRRAPDQVLGGLIRRAARAVIPESTRSAIRNRLQSGGSTGRSDRSGPATPPPGSTDAAGFEDREVLEVNTERGKRTV